MGSQFYGLNIAYTGLLASNASLNTTANNISNVETEGYSRQQVTQTAADSLRTYATYGCMGSGVDVKGVNRVRDEFYDTKYWNNQKNVGEFDKKAYYMEQLQDYLLDNSSIKGFTTIFDELTNALEELDKSAGDETKRSQFAGYAQNLATYFNEMSSNLSKIQEDINSEIKIKVDEINSYAEEIASLNKQINVIELTGAQANELRDQRTLLVDKLSQVVDVQVTETAIIDTNNPDRVTGASRYRVTIAGGQTLVDINEYNTLKCVALNGDEKAYQSDLVGLYTIKWSNDADFGMYNASMGGELAGLIQMRDGNNGEFFNGTVTKVAKDTVGNTKVSIAVSDDYLLDLKQSTLPNSGIISVSNTLYKYSDWSFNLDTKEYTFNLLAAENESELPNGNRVGKQATTNQAVNYQGVPYYQALLNEWVRSYAKGVNDVLTSDGTSDNYGNKGSNLFTGMRGDATELGFRREDNIDRVITSSDDCYRMLTASNFKVSSMIMEDPNKLATRTDSAAGQDKANIVKKLIDLKDDRGLNFRGTSAGAFLEKVLSDVALNTERAKTFRDNSETLSGVIDNQRTSISGVDQDEEAVNLVKFQNAYNLASKVIQVLTEVYDRLILETGV